LSQSIFDNDLFFEKYRELRSKNDNYNCLVEQPAIKGLFPDLEGKAILDLGCGYGSNCVDFISKGASRVVGIDISHKMLEVAQKENSNELIEYMLLDMNHIGDIAQKFDLVLALSHFIT
jgi:2-polyprenyl-3-methyl-5-hydroxy-6-metoxy-1,4-benzoquinol methylase